MKVRPSKQENLPPQPPAESAPARRIVAAARRHFFAHGFRSVTMDDLAEELGMSKKTLYASFPSKTALLRAVLLDKFGSVEADLEQISARCSSDVLRALHETLACMRRQTEEIQPPFVRDIRRERPEMFKLVESRRRALIQRYFGRIFDEGRRAGIFRKDIPAQLMIEILLGATEAIMNPPKLAEIGLTPKDGYLGIITVVLEGLLTAKGRSRDPRREGEKEFKDRTRRFKRGNV
jgi:AcrR family transcriptional regulator